MQKHPNQGGTAALANQPAARKANAWWRRLRLGRSVRRLSYVISEGEVWFGRKTPDGRAWVWIQADESMLAMPAANDGSFRKRG
jgi:hypothetical protein